MFIPILGNERETREGGTEKRTRGGDGETHKGGTEKRTFFGTHGQTDRQTQVHIEVVPT